MLLVVTIVGITVFSIISEEAGGDNGDKFKGDDIIVESISISDQGSKFSLSTTSPRTKENLNILVFRKDGFNASQLSSVVQGNAATLNCEEAVDLDGFIGGDCSHKAIDYDSSVLNEVDRLVSSSSPSTFDVAVIYDKGELDALYEKGEMTLEAEASDLSKPDSPTIEELSQ
jgi:hypothetical protein